MSGLTLTLLAFQVSIFLEELKDVYGLDYAFQKIDIFKGVQKEEWFTKLNPNATVPVLIDHDNGGFAIMETNAILGYLRNKVDKKNEFWFEDDEAWVADMWMNWKQGGLAPIAAQANHFYRWCPTRYPYPTQRFLGETERLYGILDRRLQGRHYVAGKGRGKYSVADISIWPFIDGSGLLGLEMERWPDLYKWWERVGGREAVKRGKMVPDGKEFEYGYEKVKEREGRGLSEEERGLREEGKKAMEEFGYVYKSP